MLDKLIQQKEERVADLETLRARRDQAKAECIRAISSGKSSRRISAR
jgi:hypothetical protein